MTGEVASINPDGMDSNGEYWPVHAYVAQELGRELRPYDNYIGPYIACKEGKLFISSDDGYDGTVCLWTGGIAPAYCEPIVSNYFNYEDKLGALIAARECLQETLMKESKKAIVRAIA